MTKIIRLTEKDLTKLVKRVIKEQSDMTKYNYNMAVQCFLTKKGIKDNSGQKLEMDGRIGSYPKSKTAQAIVMMEYGGLILWIKCLKPIKQYTNNASQIMVTFLTKVLIGLDWINKVDTQRYHQVVC